MATQSKTYHNVTVAQFTSIRQALSQALHVDIDPNATSGDFQTQGFTINWGYLAPAQLLTLTLTGSIFKMPFAWSAIDSHVHEFLT